MSTLFLPLQLRSVVLRNRIALAPMCQYSAQDGVPTDWHLMHYGARAAGGAGLLIVEATAVCPEGRISAGDLGLWSDDQADALRRLTTFIADQGAVPAVQLAHAGRKGCTAAPWLGGEPVSLSEGGWNVVGASAIPFSPEYPTPRELDIAGIDRVVDQFAQAATRSLNAGFKALELHMAHGYLLHSFLSPLSNVRTDSYGGNLENRTRLPLRVAEAVREVWPDNLPLIVRISCTDWVDGGWDLPQSIQFCTWLKSRGIDLIDCSSGGNVATASVPAGPGFQTPFARAVRDAVGIPTGAVGFLTSPEQAEHVVATGDADLVLLGRELLRDPQWPLRAAKALGVDVPWPKQYLRAT